MSNWYRFVQPKDPDKDDYSPTWLYANDKKILKDYFPYWKEQMIKAGKADLISEDRCIEDWVVVNWAEKMGEAESILLEVISNEEAEKVMKEVLRERSVIVNDLADR